jgi:hypothetical protein
MAIIVDRYLMNQTVVPGLSDVRGYMDLHFKLELIGVDEYLLCSNSCGSSSASIPGEFKCETGVPVNQNGCTITFTPTFSPTIRYPVVDAEFTIHFVAPSMTSQAVKWSINSLFAVGHTYGASGTIVPQSPENEVMFGSKASTIGILLRPAILERANRLFGDKSLTENLSGYLSYLGDPVEVGDTINATTYFAPQYMDMTPGVGDGIIYGPNPGVSVTLTAIRDSSVTHFIVYVIHHSCPSLLSLVVNVLLVTIEMRRIHQVCY